MTPIIQKNEIEGLVDRLDKIFAAGGLQLSYKDPETRREYSWQIISEQLATWIQVKKDNEKLKTEIDKLTKTNARYQVSLFDHGNFKSQEVDKNKKERYVFFRKTILF